MRRNGDTATISVDEFHNTTVAAINLRLQPGHTTKNEVVSWLLQGIFKKRTSLNV